MRRLGFALALALVACGGTSAPPAQEPDNGPVKSNVEEPEQAAAPAVVIHYAAMSWVMDSPEGQMDKAGDAVRESGLVTRLTSLGVEITYQPDDSLDDELVVFDGDEELGREDLRTGTMTEGFPEALVDAIKAHFAL